MKFETLQQVADQLDRIALAVETSKKYGTAPVLDEGQLREMAACVRSAEKRESVREISEWATTPIDQGNS